MNCCICGPVKNCGPFLNKVLENIEKIGSLFEDYTLLIYYDKSSDNTLQILKEYQNTNPKFKLFINSDTTSPFRTHNIATARNYCISYIRQNVKFFPFFIMMDMDDVCSKPIDVNILENHLKRNDWDSLSFNHPSGYYDTWALSIRPYVASCHHFSSWNHGQLLINRLIQYYPKNKLIPCLSAFNGFAIYKTAKFINCEYDGKFRLDYIPRNFLMENILHCS